MFGFRHNLVLSVSSRNKPFPTLTKKEARTDIKIFDSCPILLDFFTLFQIFSPEL